MNLFPPCSHNSAFGKLNTDGKPRINEILKGKGNAALCLMDPHIVNFSGINQPHAPATSFPVPHERGLGWAERRSVYLGPQLVGEGEKWKRRPYLCYELQWRAKTVVNEPLLVCAIEPWDLRQNPKTIHATLKYEYVCVCVCVCVCERVRACFTPSKHCDKTLQRAVGQEASRQHSDRTLHQVQPVFKQEVIRKVVGQDIWNSYNTTAKNKRPQSWSRPKEVCTWTLLWATVSLHQKYCG